MPISSFLGWTSSFSVMLEMSSLGAFFGRRSSLLFWQEGSFIFVGKRNTAFTNIQKTSYFHVFFEEYHFSFSVCKQKKMIFLGKRNEIFPHDIRKIIFQCDFFWKDHLFRIFRKRKYVFSCSVKRSNSVLARSDLTFASHLSSSVRVSFNHPSHQQNCHSSSLVVNKHSPNTYWYSLQNPQTLGSR